MRDKPEIEYIRRTGYPRKPDNVFNCQNCDQEVYPNEEIYFVDDVWVCPECFDDRMKDFSRDERADLMGINHVNASEAI